jgi:hypothetical protein
MIFPNGVRSLGRAAVVALVLFVTSCNSVRDKQLVEDGVTQFHLRLNTEQYHVIYSEADDRFRQVTTEPDMVALLGAIHKKLGAARQSQQRSYQVG